MFGCNLVGIVLGAYTCNYLYVKRLNWIYVKSNTTTKKPLQNKLSTLVEKFKPNFWQRHNWTTFSSPKRFGQILFYCFFVLCVDCNNFFLKFILWVPADHRLLSVRLGLWAFSAIAATKEYHEYITNKYCYRFGPFVWLTTLTLMMELSIVFKFGRTMFHAPFPWYVFVIWGTIGTLVAMGFAYAAYNERKNKDKI